MDMGAAKGKKASSLADAAVEKYAGKRKTQKAESSESVGVSEKFAQIESNLFHQVVIQSDADPHVKRAAVTRALAYNQEESKEDNEARIAAFEEFKEYLMAYRKEMSKEIIRLADTEAFSELQSVFEDMNSALLQFEVTITPLVEIIDAVHRLNLASDGAMYDVFKEIQEDKEEEARIEKERAEQMAQLDRYDAEIRDLQRDIAALREEKSWFGLGGIKQSALQEIARKEVDITSRNKEIGELRKAIESRVNTRESKFAQYANEKAQLRELLDITSDEHKERQEALVKAALNFVNTTEERTGGVLERMNGIRDQIKNVDTVNGNMKRIFAVVTDGIKEAETDNADVTHTLKSPVEGESTLEQYDREDKLQAVNEHVEALTASKVDTLATLGELQEESMNIKSMRDTNTQQISHTRKMHTSGTAGVASRLSTVLTAVSSAALNEARTTTQNTLKNMNVITQEIAQNEAIKNATNLHVQNDELSRAIEQLASYKEISDKATEITRTALAEQKELQKEMEETAADLAGSIKVAKGVTAEVMQEEESSEAPPVERRNEAASPSHHFANLKL
jgi:chromosome segregation ATPase